MFYMYEGAAITEIITFRCCSACRFQFSVNHFFECLQSSCFPDFTPAQTLPSHQQKEKDGRANRKAHIEYHSIILSYLLTGTKFDSQFRFCA